MSDTLQQSETFLRELISDFKLDLDVRGSKVDEGFYFDLTGDDSSLLLNESGELLDAFEVLLFQVHGKEIDKSERFICDADGFRQTRRAELHAMARFAAQSVRKSSNPFTFGKLNSTERRVIHLVLQDENDLLTESIGDGKDRRLRISLK